MQDGTQCICFHLDLCYLSYPVILYDNVVVFFKSIPLKKVRTQISVLNLQEQNLFLLLYYFICQTDVFCLATSFPIWKQKLNHWRVRSGSQCCTYDMCLFFFCVCFQIEMKLKILESKHQEEKLKMQQRHDADVEKVRILSER